MASYPFYRFRTPVGPYISEDLWRIGQEIVEEHGHAVKGIIFSGEDIRLTNPVPVKLRVKEGFHEVPVREVVSPLTLALETSHESVVTYRFFFKT